MPILKSGETQLAYEEDVTSGTIGFGGVNDAYDLYLVELADGNYRLIVFMKVQFSFEDSAAGRWTGSEKAVFVRDWQTAISSKWGGRKLMALKSGKTLTINFRFHTQIGGWMADHWEINVKKAKTFAQSSVNPITGSVRLDSHDLRLTKKASRLGGKAHYQRGAVHEFGHMLGLADEYHPASPYGADYKSVMHSGETVLSRHDMPYFKWALQKLNDLGIK